MSDEIEDAIASEMGDDDPIGHEPEAEDPEDPEDEEAEAVAVADEQPSSLQVMEDRGREWDRVSKYLARNMGEIMGDEAILYTECPICRSFGTPGYVLPEPPPPEILPVLHQWLGMRSDDEFKQDPLTEACPVCDGLGEVLSGSRRIPNDKISCARCQALGWIEKQPGARSRAALAPNGNSEAAASAPEGSVQTPPADVQLSASARQAQAEGYLVIPMTPASA